MNTQISLRIKPFVFVIALLAVSFARSFAAHGKVLVTATAQTDSPMAAGGGAAVLVTIKIQPGYHINTNPASEDFLIPVEVKISGKEGISPQAPIYPPGKKITLAFSPQPVSVFEGEVYIPVPLLAAPDAKQGKHTLTGTVRYQACNDKTCLIPSEAKFSFEVVVKGTEKGSKISSGSSTAPGKRPELSPEAKALGLRYKVVSLPSIIFLDGAGNERKDLRASGELTRAAMLKKLEALKSGDKLETGSRKSFVLPAQFQSVPVWVLLGLMFLSWSVVLKSKKIVAVPLVFVALGCGYMGWQVRSRPDRLPSPDASGANAKVNWPEASQASLIAAKNQGQPVVLDFRAEWCLPCHRIESEVFAQTDVKAAADGVGLFQVDMTNAPRG